MMMTKIAKETKESYIKQVRNQRDEDLIKWDIEINIKLVFGDKLRRDRDNRHKISMDAMEWIVFEDDRQIKKATVEMFYKPKEFYIEIEINAKVCEDSIWE
jgi:Holliday junction resolvase RusA-like endonuclease